MNTKKETNEKQPIPHHSPAVERVAKEIVFWSAIAAGFCTIIVMVISV